MARGYDVFIAHASADEAAARALYDALLLRGGRPFLAMTMEGGELWQLAIPKALRESRIVAVLVSEHAGAAVYLQAEIADAVAQARRGELRVVPVLLAKGLQKRPGYPYGLRPYQHLDHTVLGADGVARSLLDLAPDVADLGDPECSAEWRAAAANPRRVFLRSATKSWRLVLGLGAGVSGLVVAASVSMEPRFIEAQTRGGLDARRVCIKNDIVQKRCSGTARIRVGSGADAVAKGKSDLCTNEGRITPGTIVVLQCGSLRYVGTFPDADGTDVSLQQRDPE